MKKTIAVLTVACALLGATLAFAKQAQSATSRRVSQLDLSADQKTKVDPIVAEDAKKLRALREDATLSADDKKAKESDVRKDTDAKLKAVLTDDQWKKYQELKSEKKAGSKKKNP